MIDFSMADVIFQLGDVRVALVHNYEQTGWPGLVVQYTDGGQPVTVKAPLDVMHAVQMCAFNFTSLCKKIEQQQDMIIDLREKLADKSESADVIPFKPKGV